ncbi:MAG TPA: hypothetical protein VG992_00815 [Candidatus Saccharimonadales bacterium]|nr:hypothetical protein [Candidatus Saccharimonadales bacterium]
MASTVYINGQRRQLSPKSVIGHGGEANIYQLEPGTVLKRYKEADDPDYALDPHAQQGAVERLLEQQHKLKAFPSRLPATVVVPRDLAFDKAANGRVVGYTMRHIENAEVLLRWGDRLYREQGGIDGNQVLAVFGNLHQTVQALHTADVVIGDFNDLNVLVAADGQAYMVDADSWQFGRYFCRAFTARFVDPLLCQPTKLVLSRPHNQQSDWYAFTVMLLQSLVYVGPYGGVHRPKQGRRLQHDDRVLKRLTVFDGEVVYPKPALPLSSLPDELLEYLHKVFEQDERGDFPIDLLQSLRWTTCTQCGLAHGRSVCPGCAAPGVVKATVVIRGAVTATRLFRTEGQLLYATVQNGKLRYLYHESGAFRREDGQTVLTGQLQPTLRFRLQHDATWLAQGERLFVLTPNQAPKQLPTGTYRNLSMFDTNENHGYWLQNGQLVREDRFGERYIGDVLPNQTLFWMGRKFGFGFYRAGQLLRAFVFDSERPGLNDQVAIPSWAGQLVDATCVFSDRLAWFMVRVQEQGQLINRCYVIDEHGTVVASAQAGPDDESWLASGIRGHLAVSQSLYAATDEGIVQVTATAGRIDVQRTFPDTEPFVDSTTQLLPASTGMYAVSGQTISLLEIKQA